MPTELWHAEINMTDEIARQCIESQFPILMPLQSFKLLDQGWDNTVYLVNGNIIFRFPRREVAIQLIERENALLPKLQAHLPLTIPCPEYIGSPTPHYPHIFHGYVCIQGTPGHEANLSEHDRNMSIATLAHFLKALHSINATEASTMGAKTQVFDRTDIPHISAAFLERANRITKLDKHQIQHEVSAIENIALSKTAKTLVHGDLYCRHMLFEQKKLTGIIDWGDVGINHPVVDLMAVFCFYPKHCHNHFLDIYGQVDQECWAYARFLGLYSAVSIIIYGQDVCDTLLVAEGFSTLQRLNPKLIH